MRWVMGSCVVTVPNVLSPYLNAYRLFLSKFLSMNRREYVYLIQCEQFFKIGYTTNEVSTRLKGMTTGNPFEIKIITVFEFEKGAQNIEQKLHREFGMKRIRGEWFALSFEDVCSINSKYKDRIIESNVAEFKTVKKDNIFEFLFLDSKKNVEHQARFISLLNKRIEILEAQNKMLNSLLLFHRPAIEPQIDTILNDAKY